MTKEFKTQNQLLKPSPRKIRKKQIEQKLLDNNIGYLRIPSMSPKEEEIQDELHAAMESIKNTKALIIDFTSKLHCNTCYSDVQQMTNTISLPFRIP